MSDIHILVVDDEESMTEFLTLMLKKEGYIVESAQSGEEALQYIEKNIYDLVISDIQMGEGINGVELLKRIKTVSEDTMVLLITAYATVETALEAFREGAWDYLMKPFDVNEIKIKIRKAIDKRRLEDEVIRLRKEVSDKYQHQNIIGKDKKMQQVYTLIEKVAKTDAAVLITGESGTGKDLVAKAIHYSSNCKDGPFISINCPAIPESLLESELFGHMKGAFTGAVQNKKGLFEQANEGTMFLDEIGELPLQMQVKLLKVLQEKKFRRVGGMEEITSNFRLICATNRDLLSAIEDNHFREDLYYRINVIQIDMPALRVRKGDIPLLIEHFIRKYQGRTEKLISGITREALAVLMDYSWPGNIRQLENTIERAMTLEYEDKITLDSLPDKIKDLSQRFDKIELGDNGLDLKEYLDKETKRYLIYALKITGGVHTKAAKMLRMPVRSIRYLIEKYDLKDIKLEEPE
jgi:two-component system response regulator PilR (NtrC family)